MGTLNQRIKTIIQAFEGKFSVFKKHPPIDTAQGFGDFLATRSSFIAQKTLYGYLKTRMGMQFPKMFEDDLFIQSINISKWHVYAACLSDLTIYMCAHFHRDAKTSAAAKKMAKYWFAHILEKRFDSSDGFDGNLKKLTSEFDARLKSIDWTAAVDNEEAFLESPKALIKWAPIDDKLKSFDAPLVRNSIRFQWLAVKREYHKLLHHQAVASDWANYKA